MAAFTPGPWKAYNQIGSRILQTWRIARAAGDGGIATLDESLTGDEQVANAHLIAAAPALYAELQDFVNRWSKYPKPPTGKDLEIYLDKARAALALADGK